MIARNLPQGWPTVRVDDPGIRPAGEPDKCFYCGQSVGAPHGDKCAVVEKLVRVKYTVEVEIYVPYFWEASDVEFHRNHGSWCASNVTQDIESYGSRQQKDNEDACLCNNVECEFIRVVDESPIVLDK